MAVFLKSVIMYELFMMYQCPLLKLFYLLVAILSSMYCMLLQLLRMNLYRLFIMERSRKECSIVSLLESFLTFFNKLITK